MILEGEDAILKNRKLMGATDPKKADENTIRKCMDYQLIKIQSTDLTHQIMPKKK